MAQCNTHAICCNLPWSSNVLVCDKATTSSIFCRSINQQLESKSSHTMQSLCSSESMRRNFTTLVAANVNEAKKGSKKRRPTSTLTETYIKVNQQAIQQKINALRETLRLQKCSTKKLSDKGTHSRNKRWKSMMKSKHPSNKAFSGRPPCTRIGKTLPSLAT